ncbi:MAG: acetolactate decarboxylase [Bacteroidota bacterium]
MKLKILIFALTVLLLISCDTKTHKIDNNVKIVGAMKNVMWKGQLYGNINLDTISNKKHLLGLGPVEYLTGEILIIDGKSYEAKVLTDSTMKVEETYEIKAPFFGYCTIEKWEGQILSDSIQTISQLENYLDLTTKKAKRPFMFKLEGIVDEATIHIVNLPKGSKVSSPDEAHKGLTSFKLKNQQADIIGFFSTEHKTIFTHHDTYLHMHLITSDRTKMGHLDKVNFKKGSMKLYLPSE